MSNADPLRGTGRTRRMLCAAVEAAAEGNQVQIRTASLVQAGYLSRILHSGNIPRAVLNRIIFTSVDAPFKGGVPDVVLVDHYAAEKKLRSIREQLEKIVRDIDILTRSIV